MDHFGHILDLKKYYKTLALSYKLNTNSARYLRETAGMKVNNSEKNSMSKQGTLTDGEGSVQLTSLY